MLPAKARARDFKPGDGVIGIAGGIRRHPFLEERRKTPARKWIKATLPRVISDLCQVSRGIAFGRRGDGAFWRHRTRPEQANKLRTRFISASPVSPVIKAAASGVLLNCFIRVFRGWNDETGMIPQSRAVAGTRDSNCAGMIEREYRHSSFWFRHLSASVIVISLQVLSRG
jgi:hypothetical protein